MIKVSKKPPRTKKPDAKFTRTFSLGPEDLDHLRKISRKTGRSLSELVRIAIKGLTV